jgi:hypothetical protein
MLAVDFLIDRLNEQIELASKLEENTEAGGSIEGMKERLKEGINLASEIDTLRSVEGGSRLYGKHFAAALKHVEELAPIFAKVRLVQGAAYADLATREKAMAQFKPTPDKIVSICKAAIGELEKARKIYDQGEGAGRTVAAKGS